MRFLDVRRMTVVFGIQDDTKVLFAHSYAFLCGCGDVIYVKFVTLGGQIIELILLSAFIGRCKYILVHAKWHMVDLENHPIYSCNLRAKPSTVTTKSPMWNCTFQGSAQYLVLYHTYALEK